MDASQGGPPTPLADNPHDLTGTSTRGSAARKAVDAQHDYAMLDGASGRAVFFRPQRMGADELAPLRLGVTFTTRDDTGTSSEISGAVVDVSQSGLAGLVPLDTTGLGQGALLPRVVLHIDDAVFYDGRATVAVSRRQGDETRVGLALTDGLIDVDQVKYLRDVRRWDRDAKAPLDSAHTPWAHVGDHAEFKAELLDLRLYLDETQARLDEFEQRLPWAVLHGGTQSPALQGLIDLTTRDLQPEFDRRVGSLFNLVRELPVEESKALVPLSERMVRDHFVTAPWLHRAWKKPLGYAGDYQVMNHMYRCQFEGPTLFAKAMSWASLHAPSPEAVRTRKALIKQMLHELFAPHLGQGTTVRVLSVASGPAQEMFEILRDIDELPHKLEIVLFDQDPGALAFAHGRLHHLVDRRWQGRVKVIYLHDTIRRLAAGHTVLGTLGAMDAVYSTGLYDYLPHHFAVKLTRRLFQLLKPGGWAAIGNMDYANPNRWVMEHLLDWWLIFRSRDEMRAFASEAAPEATLSFRTEATGINPFVVMQR